MKGLNVDKYKLFNSVFMLTGSVSFKKFKDGNVLYYEGDSNDMLYFLLSGRVKAYKMAGDSEVFLYSLSSYDLVSDLVGECSNTVEFLEDSEVMCISKDAFFRSISSIDIANFLYRRNELLNVSITVNLTLCSAKRVAYMLLNDLKLFNSQNMEVNASQLNMQPSTITRITTSFLRDGLISGKVRNRVIEDKERLEKLLSE